MAPPVPSRRSLRLFQAEINQHAAQVSTNDAQTIDLASAIGDLPATVSEASTATPKPHQPAIKVAGARQKQKKRPPYKGKASKAAAKAKREATTIAANHQQKEVGKKRLNDLPRGHPALAGFDFERPYLPLFNSVVAANFLYNDTNNPPPFAFKISKSNVIGMQKWGSICEEQHTADGERLPSGEVGETFVFKWGGDYAFYGAMLYGMWYVLWESKRLDRTHAYMHQPGWKGEKILHIWFGKEKGCGCGKVLEEELAEQEKEAEESKKERRQAVKNTKKAAKKAAKEVAKQAEET